jgi:hypothetical protein
MNPTPRQIAITAAILALIGVGLWLAISGGESPRTTPVDFEEDGWSGASVAAKGDAAGTNAPPGGESAGRRPVPNREVRGGNNSRGAGRQKGRRRGRNQPPTARRADQPDRPGSNRPDNPSDDPTEPDNPTSDTGTSPDTGNDRGYSDPVNDQVLGPRRWMAELPKEEAESIERQLSEEIEPEFDVAKKDRRRVTDEVHRLAQRCWRQFLQGEPGVRGGQLIVEFEMVAKGGTARVEDPTVTDVVDVRDPDFLACIRDRAADVQTPAERDGSMAIQLPIFFGGTGYRE